MSDVSDLFQSAFDHMPTPAFIIQLNNGEIVGSNQGFRALFTNQVVVPPSHWLELSAMSKDQSDWEWLANEIDLGNIERCQETILIGTASISAELGFQALGEEHFLVCVYSTDYMDLSAAENTLLKFALSESSAGLWLWEVESDLIACSESISVLLGCQPIESPQSTEQWHDLVHPEDLAKLKNTVEEHVKHCQKYYEAEYRIRKGDGSYLWVKERGRTYSQNSLGEVSKVIGFVEDISARKALEEHLRNQATFDELTGLLNRGAALSHFKKQLGLAKRQYTPLTMVKINIAFDNCLDNLSTEDRDDAIQAAAKFIYSKTREADVLARVEAEKLLLLLPNTGIRDAQKLLQEIITPDPSLCIVLESGEQRELSFCAGLAAFPEDGETIEELAESANSAVESCANQQIKIALN